MGNTKETANTRQSLYGFLRLFTMPIETLLRSGFGERYINTFNILIPTLAFWVFHEIATPFMREFMGNGIKIVFIVVPILGVGHIVLRRLIDKEGQSMTHSYYAGEPWLIALLPTMKETTIKYFIEPAVIFVLGAIFYFISLVLTEWFYGLGLFLMVSSFMLLIRGQMEYIIQRGLFLDKQDSHIETNALINAFNGEEQEKKDPRETNGFAIPGSIPKNKVLRQDLLTSIERLDPSLQKLMQTSKDKTPQKEYEPKAPEPVKVREIIKDIEV